MAGSIANFFISIGADMSEFEREMDELQRSMRGVGEKLSQTGESMTKAISLPLAAIGGMAMKGASDVQAAQGKIQASLGLTKEEAAALTDTAKDIWKAGFGESLGEVSDAVATVQKNIKGLNKEDLKTITKNAYTLSEAFGADITESTAAASVMMKNFGIDATQALDLMTIGFQKGGDFSGELLDTLREYSPQFAALGMSAEDMMNILISGAEAGAWNLDKVGDAVKEFNIRAKDGSKTTAEGFAAIGLNAEEMAKKIAAGGDSAKNAYNATITALAAMEDPVARNAAGVALFGTQWEDLEANVISAMTTTTDHLGDYEGAAEKAGAAMKDNFGDKLKSTIRNLQIALEPLGMVLINMANAVLPIVTVAAKGLSAAFSALPGPIQTVVAVIGTIAAAAGPVLAILGSMLGAISNLIPVFTKLGPVINIIRTSLTALTGPVGIIIAITTALATIIIANWDQIKEFLLATWETIKAVAEAVWTGIKDFFSATWETIKSVVMTVWEGITGFLSAIWEGIAASATAIWDGIKAYFEFVINFWKTLFETIWNGITSFLTTLWEGISATAQTIWNAIKAFFETLLTGIKTVFETIWNVIKTVVTTVWNAIKSAGEAVWNAISSFITTIVNTIKTVITTVFNAIKNVITTVWNTVKNISTTVWNAIKNTLSGIWNGIKNMASNLFNGLKNTISNVMNKIKNTIMNIWGNITGAVREKITEFTDIGKNIVEGLWNGIKGMGTWIKDKVTGFFSGIVDGVKGLLGIASPSKLFKQFGNYLAEGLAIGIDSEAHLAEDSAAIMADAVAKAGQPAPIEMGADIGSQLAGYAAAPHPQQIDYNQLAAAIASIQGPGVIVQNMQVRNDQDIIKISRELYALQQQNRRARGER